MPELCRYPGTRHGATADQLVKLIETLYKIGATEIHHGDCIGVDEQAHNVARELFLNIVIHPPQVDVKRAFCEGKKVTVLEPLPYLDRNKQIVNETDLLIALPGQVEEQLRSGTWATVRYAQRLHRPFVLITPAGKVV